MRLDIDKRYKDIFVVRPRHSTVAAAKVISLDISDEQVRRDQEMGNEYELGVDWVQGTMTDLSRFALRIRLMSSSTRFRSPTLMTKEVSGSVANAS